MWCYGAATTSAIVRLSPTLLFVFHVVVSGYCRWARGCFLGVNAVSATCENRRDCVIGAGAVVVKDTAPGKVYKGDRDGVARQQLSLFKVKEAG